MSLVAERETIKEVILINPATINVERPTVSDNENGIPVKTDIYTPVEITNPVRIALSKKPGANIGNEKGKYFTTLAYYVLCDYETILKSGDRFTWNNLVMEVKHVTAITYDGGVRNYQAELKEFTSGQA